MNSVDHQILLSWQRIDTWLRSHSDGQPAHLMSPAAQADIDAVARELGLPLPSDLVSLWQLENVSADYWLPPQGGAALIEPAAALRDRAIWLNAAADEDPDDPNLFPPGLLPIASNGGGDNLVIELRPNQHHGAIFLWDHENWGLRVPLWPDVATMLDDVAQAMESGKPALLDHAAQGGDEPPCVPLVNDWNEFEGWVVHRD
ncbi:SMI1/KNR4 family protein [Goodfellowiella coeruleoviolacea]|uniref:Cell wall assembly regulator SMI1 n=1 Tax=Goodfellowiella coeruleoviolacea TaxID=334858 RepID=A0AAE3KHC0_9PSEU|nr:SMI1/KNR4 family protein [Goodfellowiella coeruleoviolacea]MCP2166294.1 Cell wall assembly regulator SMI1 [Goodfellowiella coeruleoviolacea]